MKIIGIAGKAGSGKSIFAEAFPMAAEKIRGKGVITHYCSLSYDMKRMVADMIGVPLDADDKWIQNYTTSDANYFVGRELNGNSDYSHTAKSMVLDKYHGQTLRGILQGYGLMMKKVFGDRFWVNRTLERLKRVNAELVVIDGLRFKSDAKAIREAGGIVINIVDPAYKPTGDAHISETDLDDFAFDAHIENPRIPQLHGYPSDFDRHAAVLAMYNKLIKEFSGISQQV